MEQANSADTWTFREILKSKWLERVVNFVIVPALLLYSLWLPPASVGLRVFHLDYPSITEEGGTIREPGGARLFVPAGAVEKRLRLRIVPFPAADLLAGNGDKDLRAAVQAIPADLTPMGTMYRFDLHGPVPNQAIFSAPLPDGTESPTDLDLYAWDGENWKWVSMHIFGKASMLKAQLNTVPQILSLMKAAPMARAVNARMPLEGKSVTISNGILTVVSPQGLYVQHNGTIGGTAQGTTSIKGRSDLKIVPVISNIIDGVARSDLVSNIVVDENLRAKHISEILDRVQKGGYDGINIDYRDMDSGVRPEFTAFITELAEALHNTGKLLSVRVPWPQKLAAGEWDTRGYDWRAIGMVADEVELPLMPAPNISSSPEEIRDLLQWALGEIERAKLRVVLSTDCYRQIGDELETLSYVDALAAICRVAASGKECLLTPGEAITVALPNLLDAGGIKFDEDSQSYQISFTGDDGQQNVIWLENASSIARKLEMLDQFNIGGIVLDDALDKKSDARIWNVVAEFQEDIVQEVPPDFAIVWTVENADSGDPIGAEVVPIDAAKFVWTAPNNPGNYIISASISDDGGRTTASRGGAVEIEVPTPTPTPTSTPTPTPTNTPTATPTPRPTATPKPRVAAQAQRPSVGPGFGYGIQVDMITDGDHGRIINHLKQLGFTWVKQQVEWFRYNPAPGQYDWGPLDRIVDSCNANGINILFSVVKAPKWARPPGDTDEGPPADPNTYGEFLKAMASRYKGRVQAYEIWNEQNLYYEWGGRGHKLNAAKYVELLKVAYNAIKSVDPGAIVISGALTPTGVNDGDIAIDDRVYLEQMYQAGLAKYCDAVGAHPSGYNNPPDADWRNYSDPTASFRAVGHPSWFFRGTMESYRNIMVKYGDGHKRIWPTEFGWASVEGLGVPPARGYEYAADNTEAEQAQFIVRAYEMGKAWGWVGVMFLWNLNFGPVCGAGDEKAAFGIVRPDWSPRPAFHALANMPK